MQPQQQPVRDTQDHSVRAQFNRFVQSTPLGTRFLLVVMIGVFIATVAKKTLVQAGSISAYFVFDEGEVYRLFTAAFIHANILHIGFNLSSFWGPSRDIENNLGTVSFMHLIHLMVWFTGLLYVGLAWLLSEQKIYQPESIRFIYFQPAVGFSGVIFGVFVISFKIRNVNTVSFFNMFNIPAIIYPWLLLAIIQILVKNASWLGHASGIFVGYLYAYGPLKFLMLPRRAVAKLEGAIARLHSSGAVFATDPSLSRAGYRSAVVSGASGSSQSQQPEPFDLESGSAAAPYDAASAVPRTSNNSSFPAPGAVRPPSYDPAEYTRFEQNLSVLLAQGYPHDAAVSALTAAGGNLQEAQRALAAQALRR